MKSLNKIAFASLRHNKKRTVATIIGVTLSCALIFTIVGITTSFCQMLHDSVIAKYGDYHEMFQEIPGDKVSIIENLDGIKSVQYSDPVVFQDEVDSERYNATLYENGREVWPIYDTSLFTLSDHLEDSRRNSEERINVFVKYEDPNQQKALHRKITRTFETDYDLDIVVRTNSTALMVDGQSSETDRLLIYSLAIFVSGTFIVSSVLMTRNSFQIAMMERLHQFGILMSLGTRPRQIRRIIYLEALIIAAIAIPLGLLVGVAASLILIQVINGLVGSIAGFTVAFSIPPIFVLAVALLAALAVYLSAGSAAIIAGRTTPIDAIRNTNEIKINNNKKIKTSEFIKSYFGVGGVIASNNLKRSRGRYRTTVLSIIVSVAIFIGFSTLVDIAFRQLEVSASGYDADYYIDNISAEFCDKIISKFKPQGAICYRIGNAGPPYERKLQVYDRLTSLALHYPIYMVDDATLDKLIEDNRISIDDRQKAAILVTTYSVEHANGTSNDIKQLPEIETNQKYKFLTPISRQKNIHNGDVPRDFKEGMVDDDGNELTIDDFVDEDGNFWDFDEEDYEIEISATIAKPLFSVGYQSTPYLVVSRDYYQKDFFDKTFFGNNEIYGWQLEMKTDGNNREITKYIQSLMETDRDEYGKITFTDNAGNKEVIRNIVSLIGIFLYGFIAAISIIGLTNIFNTVSTNIIMRAKEFAVLKSIGMTTKEFNRMIALESFFYSLRALCFGIPIGLMMSYMIFYTFESSGYGISYQFPIIEVIISIVVVSISVSLIMLYGTHETNKQNIIETIRKDSI